MQLLHLQPLLHDEQCKNGGVASQLELHLQQTLPVFGLEPYKHPKTTKLNPNTPWMKCNKKQKNYLLLFFTFHESFYIHKNLKYLPIVLSDLFY
jgi:hypothetical protein